LKFAWRARGAMMRAPPTQEELRWALAVKSLPVRTCRSRSVPTQRESEFNELYAEFFPVDPPARMTMQVPLPRGLLISIGCVAALP
jgi:hypothetical protein